MSTLAEIVGVELGPTSWIDIPQRRIDTGRFRVFSVDSEAGRSRAKIEATVEGDAVAKHVSVAELVVLTLS